MYKKGFELLRSKAYSTEEVKLLNDLLGFEMPDCLSRFLSSFELGPQGLLGAKRKFENTYMQITFIEFHDKEIDLTLRMDEFYSTTKMKKLWEENITYNNYYYSNQYLLPFGYTVLLSDHYYVSVKDSSIWYVDDYENLVKIAENIFSFCSNLKETKILDEEFKGKQIFQNWGEDFWRIKENH